MIFKQHYLDFYYPGVEADPQNSQVLDDPVPGEQQGEIGGIPDSVRSLLLATAADNEWLTLRKITKDGVVDHQNKLKISEDGWDF